MGVFLRIVAALSLGAAGLAGCAQPQPQASPAGATTHYDPETRRLERVTYDRNGDGRTDATTFMNGAIVTHAELDEDFDGRIDRREYFVSRPSPGGGAPASLLDRVEISTGADGRVTRWERYEDGQLRHVEEDTDEDGRVDKWETWAGGSLEVVAMDTGGRGRPDRRLVYPPDGGEPRLELVPEATGAVRSAAPAP